MKAQYRLQQIKDEDKKSGTQKMIFLLNPRDTRVLQSLVAWKNLELRFDKQAQVREDIGLNELWQLCEINLKQYAITLGVTVQEAIPRLKQLKNLKMIYPDGSINQNARILVNMFIKKKINEIKEQE